MLKLTRSCGLGALLSAQAAFFSALQKIEGGELPRPLGADGSMGRLHQNNGQDKHGGAVVFNPENTKILSASHATLIFLKARVLVEPKEIDVI